MTRTRSTHRRDRDERPTLGEIIGFELAVLALIAGHADHRHTRRRQRRRNEGCRPGAPNVSAPDRPSARPVHRDLTFELSMHPGMDGAHDMTIHVPVQYTDGSSSVFDLAVTGYFRN